ncbi:MAG: hypothetical protein ABH825_03500, partial [Candidatus Omnitrophota bacterium]
ADKQAIEELVNLDPSFKAVMDRKKELDVKIQAHEAQIRELRGKMEDDLRIMQREFESKKVDIESKIALLKDKLAPEREDLEQALESAKMLLYAKKQELRDLVKMRSVVDKLIKRGRERATAQGEIDRWEERLNSLADQIGPLEAEIEELEEKKNIARLKLIAIKQ